MSNFKYFRYLICIIIHALIFNSIIQGFFPYGFARKLLIYTAISICGVMVINTYLANNGSKNKTYYSIIVIPALLWYMLVLILYIII